MSYSFSAKAANKAAAKEAVAAKFDEMVVHQPVHAHDRAAALTNANTVIDLLVDNDSKDVFVSCHGSVGWTGNEADAQFNSVNVGCNAYHIDRMLTPGT